MFSGTWASAQARARRPAPSASRARSISTRAASTSIQTGVGQLEHQLVAPGQHVGPERRAQAREQRAQGRVLRDRGAVRPQRPDQLLAPDVAVAVEHQIGEQQRHLPAPQSLRELYAVDLDRQAPAELDPGSLRAGTVSGNVLETYRQRQRASCRRWNRGQLQTQTPLAGRKR